MQNGSGKSTLFALLLNQFQADSGNIEVANGLQFAHLAQEVPALQQSALNFVLDGDQELRNLELQLQKLKKNNEGQQIALLHEKYNLIDGYAAPARAAQLLSGLGFTEVEQQKNVADFSGGWRVRLNLAKR